MLHIDKITRQIQQSHKIEYHVKNRHKPTNLT